MLNRIIPLIGIFLSLALLMLSTSVNSVLFSISLNLLSVVIVIWSVGGLIANAKKNLDRIDLTGSGGASPGRALDFLLRVGTVVAGVGITIILVINSSIPGRPSGALISMLGFGALFSGILLIILFIYFASKKNNNSEL